MNQRHGKIVTLNAQPRMLHEAWTHLPPAVNSRHISCILNEVLWLHLLGVGREGRSFAIFIDDFLWVVGTPRSQVPVSIR